MAFVSGGSFPASLIPAQKRLALNDNYLSFNDAGGNDFAQQYLHFYLLLSIIFVFVDSFFPQWL